MKGCGNPPNATMCEPLNENADWYFPIADNDSLLSSINQTMCDSSALLAFMVVVFFLVSVLVAVSIALENALVWTWNLPRRLQEKKTETGSS